MLIEGALTRQDLLAWESGDIKDSRSLKGIIAELVAFLGPEVAKEVIVSFSPVS